VPQVRVLLEYTDNNPVQDLWLVPPDPLKKALLKRPCYSSLVAKTKIHPHDAAH
jgi:hypothetical protein